MSRDLDTAFADALGEPVIRPVMFYEAEMAGGAMVRMWSGTYDRTWDGHTWEGIGDIVGIGKVEETQTLRAAAVEIIVAGIKLTAISMALQSLKQNRPGQIYFAMLDAAEAFIGGAPEVVFKGRLDSVEIQENPDGAVVVMRYENRLIDLERPRIRRFTHMDQQLTAPGDMGFEFIAALQDVTITWGDVNAPASPPLPGFFLTSTGH